MTLQTRHGCLPRRTVDELATRYELEPELRDLFVEGPRDTSIYRWFLQTSGYTKVSIFEIETVEVPPATLSNYGLRGGNRDRLIVLALALDNSLDGTLPFVRCIADSDFNFVFESQRSAKHLLYTDYTSVDMYSYDEMLIEKVLCLGFNCSNECPSTFLSSITPILLELFIVRAANERLNWCMRLPKFIKCCSIRGSWIEFDRDEFVTRCLNSNSRLRDRAEFEEVCRRLQTVHLDDPRMGIHGDDYIELFGWFLRNHHNWRGYSRGERSALAVLLPSLHHKGLSDEGLFRELTSVFSNLLGSSQKISASHTSG